MNYNAFALLLLIMMNFFTCHKPEPETLKLMTFNIRYGTADDGENSWQYRKSILLNCLRQHRPDILGVQEALAFQIDSIKSALPQFESFGVGRYHSVAVPERPHESMNGESCIILYDTTKFKLIKQSTFWHSDTPGVPGSKTWGNALPRITTWGILQSVKTAKQFTVMNTHFHWDEPYVRNTTELILRKWKDIAGSLPTILMGDFNLPPESATHKLFCGETGDTDYAGHFVDCWQAAGKPEINAGTSNKFSDIKNRDRIDWILTTPDFSINNAEIIYYNENGRFPSDHYPVQAYVQLK